MSSSKYIQKLVDDSLLMKEKNREHRVRSGKWNPSSFGRCFRFQYWNRLNEKKSNPLTIQTLRIFAAGHLFHDFIENLLPEGHDVEVEVSVDDVFGYADVVESSCVTDIKSIRSWGMKAIKKLSKEQFESDKRSNIIQVMTYAVLLHKPKGRLVFVDKDGVEIREYEFKTVDWEQDVKDELTILRQYWEGKELPPAIPRTYGGKECNYCAFHDKCLGVENPFKKEKK